METHFEASQQTNFQLLMQMFNPTQSHRYSHLIRRCPLQVGV